MSRRENNSKGAEGKTIVLNSKVEDSSSKVIFDDNTLCAQFMMDYVDILKGIEIHPDNLEDVSERYVPLIAEERNSDIVKKVVIPNKMPFYFISLIEHKTRVDYNVGIQVFRYIYQIWEDYEKDMEEQHEGISKTKAFRYPPVIPIVYYEGTDEWTASRELRDRIAMSELFGECIPNFTYQLVSLKEYSNRELLDKGDAISVMMMVNKIRDRATINQFMEDTNDRFLDIVKHLPHHLVKKIAEILRVCLFSLNVQEDEVEQIVSRVEEKKMGRLFEGVTFDVQEERKQLDAEHARIDAEHAKINAEHAQIEEERGQLDEERAEFETQKQDMIQAFIGTSFSEGKTAEQILVNLQAIFMLDETIAKTCLEQYRQEV